MGDGGVLGVIMVSVVAGVSGVVGTSGVGGAHLARVVSSRVTEGVLEQSKRSRSATCASVPYLSTSEILRIVILTCGSWRGGGPFFFDSAEDALTLELLRRVCCPADFLFRRRFLLPEIGSGCCCCFESSFFAGVLLAVDDG